MQNFITQQGDACFFRAVGVSPHYLQELAGMDALLSIQAYYKRITGFEKLTDPKKIAEYQQKQPDSDLQKVLMLWKTIMPNANQTIEKNLIISLLFWEEYYLNGFPSGTDRRKKLVCSGKIGYKEYLFCYLAFLKGIDIMLLLPEGDLQIAQAYLNVSKLLTLGKPQVMQIPDYRHKINTVHPGRKSVPKPKPQPRPSSNERKEYSYEELAKLAKSVVMLGIYDKSGEFVGSGSGIAISTDGYILTNLHVVNDGRVYAARLEHDDKIYPSFQILKYHTLFDLAVIQIERKLEPLRIFDGRSELVRGQKVVAIGSPMGFLNSVSDGIISGFRQIENQHFIQHTAAVSNGSCGGALLNTYGEVIGINTAHVIHGENMNLAVSYQQILPFILGFVK